MTPNVEKFVAEVEDRLQANGGKIPAPLYFEIGKLCGLKCKEVVDAKKEFFPHLVKGAVTGAPTMKKIAKAKKAAKKPDKKGKEVKVEKTVKRKKNQVFDESTGLVQNDESGYVWIASPEEIASDVTHTTDYEVQM